MPTPPPPIRRISTTEYREPLARTAGAPRKRAVRTGPPPLSASTSRAAALLLLVGAALTVAGLFPVYLVGTGAMVDDWSRWLYEVVPIVAWVGGGVLLVVVRLPAARAGAALAAGSLFVTTGLNLSAVLQLAVHAKSSPGFGSARAGFWLIVAGDAVAVLGAAVAVLALRRAGALRSPGLRRRGMAVVGVVVGAALVAGYLGGWRHYRLVAQSIKQTESQTVKGPFNGAWEVIVAEVVVAIGLGLVPLVSTQWDHLRAAAAALLGVALGLGGLVILNVVEVATATPRTFVSAAEVKSLKVKLTATMTTGFWVEAAAMALLLLVALVLAVRPPPPTEPVDQA